MCYCRRNIVKSVSVTDDGTDLLIEIPPLELYEAKFVDLVICQSIPTASILASHPVKIKITGATGDYMPTLNRIGNKLRADQIRTRRLYHTIYGTDDKHLYFRDKVPESNGAPRV